MKRLLIVGAGGFGREVLNWASDIPEDLRDWEPGGFLDANPFALDGYKYSYPILGDPSTYKPLKNDCFVCAIGNTKTKLDVCRQLIALGAKFITLIHPSVVTGVNNVIGMGSILCPGVVLTNDVIVNDFVTLNLQCTVGHDAFIGAGCTLSPHCSIGGFSELGVGVFLGCNASILPSAKVGDFAVVGAGSVVLRKVKPNMTVIGVPAKKIH